MLNALELIQKAQVYYLATTEGGKPRVRPFGFVMEYDGKLCFSTGAGKDVCRQMSANKHVEMSGMTSEQEWFRITGEVSFLDDKAAKEKVFQVMPALLQEYKGAEDPRLILFALENPQGSLYSFTSPPVAVDFPCGE